MKFYKYYGTIYGEQIAGIVRARSESEAQEILRKVYYDYDLWQSKTLKEARFDKYNVCEVYYGC